MKTFLFSLSLFVLILGGGVFFSREVSRVSLDGEDCLRLLQEKKERVGECSLSHEGKELFRLTFDELPTLEQHFFELWLYPFEKNLGKEEILRTVGKIQALDIALPPRSFPGEREDESFYHEVDVGLCTEQKIKWRLSLKVEMSGGRSYDFSIDYQGAWIEEEY